MSEPIVAFKFEKKEAVSSVRSSDVVHPNAPSHFSEIGDVARFRRFWEGPAERSGLGGLVSAQVPAPAVASHSGWRNARRSITCLDHP